MSRITKGLSKRMSMEIMESELENMKERKDLIKLVQKYAKENPKKTDKVNLKDLRSAMVENGIELKCNAALNIIEGLKGDANGEITPEDFIKQVDDRLNYNSKESEMKVIFRELSGGDDFISIDDVRRMCRELGQKSADAERIMNLVTDENSRDIEFDQFYAIMTKVKKNK